MAEYLEWLSAAGSWSYQALITLGEFLRTAGADLLASASQHVDGIILVAAFYAGYRLFRAGLTRFRSPDRAYAGASRRTDNRAAETYLRFFAPGGLLLLLAAVLSVRRDADLAATVVSTVMIAAGPAAVCLAYRLYSRTGESTTRLPEYLTGTAASAALAALGVIVCLQGVSSFGAHVTDFGSSYPASESAVIEELDAEVGNALTAIRQGLSEEPGIEVSEAVEPRAEP